MMRYRVPNLYSQFCKSDPKFQFEILLIQSFERQNAILVDFDHDVFHLLWPALSVWRLPAVFIRLVFKTN